ncbi:hypothetical protein Poli38472_005090 [Pythium oligandrum]|uniref:F-box domain-containing protein n=1 Tax=Pythium oligandrum TaxID=41045 RepID=A0A8K1CI04_PYTOL|nr:hypothetical protein Poli38472_005090 [Pythium oligandrum]|eukprot:TMW62472.1 hypothetical protein Poli38472_005090 [Pythium oligandrum]
MKTIASPLDKLPCAVAQLKTASSSDKLPRAMIKTAKSSNKRPWVTPTPSPFDKLPLALLQEILKMLLTKDLPAEFFVEIPEPEPVSYLTLALVCKLWHNTVTDIHSHEELSELRMRLCKPKRQDMLDFRRHITLRRTRLNTVFVKADSKDHAELLETSSLWAPMFQHTPELRALRLVEMPAEVASTIVDSASRSCPRLANIQLPGRFDSPSTSRTKLMKTVACAMERSYNSEVSEGMRVLGFPLLLGTDPHKQSTEYVENISKWCPKFRAHNIFSCGMTKEGRFMSQEQWVIDRVTWERFCASCVELDMFNWTPIPFSTEFFEIFGKHPKPALRELQLVAPANWSWDRYFKATRADPARGFGWNARNPGAIFRACPGLRRLFIRVPAQSGDGRLPMNQEIFGDDFCEALVSCCPDLTSFELLSVDGKGRGKQDTITAFTDRSLRLLGSLEFLTKLDIKAVNISGEAVFDLVMSKRRCQRTYTITVGDDSGPAKMAFFGALNTFLVLLADCNEPIPRLVMNLNNRHADSDALVDRAWSERYLWQLRVLVRLVRQRHPSLTLRIVLLKVDGESFGDILRFTMFTDGMKVPNSMELCPFDEKIEDGFYHRDYPFESIRIMALRPSDLFPEDE